MANTNLPQNIFIKGQRGLYFTPDVGFDFKAGLFYIKGESYLEDTVDFYDPLIKSLREFLLVKQYPYDEIIFHFSFSYFNTSTAKALLNMSHFLKKIERDTDLKLTVNWFYPDDDYEILAEAEDLMECSRLRFNLIPYKFVGNLRESDKLLYRVTKADKNTLDLIDKTKQDKAKVLELDLQENLTSFPREITELESLEILRLGGKKTSKSSISYIPPEISNLKRLRVLELRNNWISYLPTEISQLKKLEKIYLSGNYFEYIPDSLGELPNLKNLHLTANQIQKFPENLAAFCKLEKLFLGQNQIKTIPPNIQELKELRELHIDNNPITELPAEISKLPKLKKIYVHNCKITHLPKEIVQLTNLDTLFIDNNPLQYPPIEIIDQGMGAIQNYFDEAAQGTTRNYEAKLITVGNGRTGKTSVNRRIINNTYNKNEPSTHGLRIGKFSIPNFLRKHPKIDVNYWDFGGQEIYHATHRFFLNTRALYLLVWDQATKIDALQNPQKEENFSFTYWLDYIKALSHNSPVLIVQNKIDLGKAFIDNANTLVESYNVKDFVDVSAATNENMKQLKLAIQKQFAQAQELKDIIGIELPASWVRVKDKLKTIAVKKNYISYREYLDICQSKGVDEKSAQNLSHNFLHQIGVVLHFPQPRQLKNLVILNPHWVTEAVYKLLEAENVMQQKGYFDEDDIDEIWGTYDPNEQISFVELMKKFELLFEIPQRPKHYIVPQLLPQQCPETLPQLKGQHITLVYQYKFMHKGIISRLVSRLSNFTIREHYWKNGVILTQNDTKARIDAKPQHQQIWIKVEVGAGQTFLLDLIKLALKGINSDFDVEIFVPYTSSEANTTHFFALEDLELRATRGIEEAECPLSFDRVSVAYLLTGEASQSQSSSTDVQEIKKLVALAQLGTAFEKSLATDEIPYQMKDQVLILQASFNHLKNQEMLGKLGYTEIAREKSKLTYSLLQLLGQIKLP